jgi:hypothetical protein
MSGNCYPNIDDLVSRLIDALNTRGQVTSTYRNELERDLLRIAAARAARSLGRPTRCFDRPDRIHLRVTDWGSSVPQIRASDPLTS